MESVYSSNFTILHQLNPKFKQQIKFVSIFGENGDKVIITTRDDNIFAFGDNTDGCLGLGGISYAHEPIKLDPLCHKDVINIAYGTNHVLAVTKSGEVYSWGLNTWGQLGNRTTIDSSEPKLIGDFSGKIISEICCGANHSLAISDLGKLYAWGRNDYGQIGNANYNNQLAPVLVNALYGQRIVAISCGLRHSLALTDSGEVYGFGYNREGQLGVGTHCNQNTPIMIRVNLNQSVSVSIRKIACGLGHSLLLSTEGDIYAFGFNGFGQIGNGHKNDQRTPIKINALSAKFDDIGSELASNISVAFSHSNGYCYVWGECDFADVTAPKQIPVKSAHEAFALYSKRRVTHKPIHFEENNNYSQNRIFKCLDKAFNDDKYGDIAFKMGEKMIFAQKWFLMINCSHFETMFASNVWCESKLDTKFIEITDYSYEVYYAFLKYLYTDSVDIAPEFAIELLELANCYLEEDLKQSCVEIIKNSISIDTVCALYSVSIKHNSEDLEKFCFKFALNSLNDVFLTDGFLQMDNSVKKLIQEAAKLKKFS